MRISSIKSLSAQLLGQSSSRSTISSTNTGITSRSSRQQATLLFKSSGTLHTLTALYFNVNDDCGPVLRAGTVESRLRQLVMKLEFVESLQLAHPFIKGFEQISYCLSEEEMRAVAQGEISEAVAKRTKEDIEGKEGANKVYTSTFYIGLAIEARQGMSLTGSNVLRIVVDMHS